MVGSLTAFGVLFCVTYACVTYTRQIRGRLERLIGIKYVEVQRSEYAVFRIQTVQRTGLLTLRIGTMDYSGYEHTFANEAACLSAIHNLQRHGIEVVEHRHYLINELCREVRDVGALPVFVRGVYLRNLRSPNVVHAVVERLEKTTDEEAASIKVENLGQVSETGRYAGHVW